MTGEPIIGDVTVLARASGEPIVVESIALFDGEAYDSLVLGWLWARAWLDGLEA